MKVNEFKEIHRTFVASRRYPGPPYWIALMLLELYSGEEIEEGTPEYANLCKKLNEFRNDRQYPVKDRLLVGRHYDRVIEAGCYPYR